MRVNIYAEEMTSRTEIISKEIDGQTFTGLRFYLELPATVGGQQYQGPFIHRPGDDDSSAVTFWGKQDLRKILRKALANLDEYYDADHDPKPPGDSAPALQTEWDRAADFYRRCKADPKSSEVGAMRDAVEWLCSLAAKDPADSASVQETVK